jgi:hypothetical protein
VEANEFLRLHWEESDDDAVCGCIMMYVLVFVLYKQTSNTAVKATTTVASYWSS